MSLIDELREEFEVQKEVVINSAVQRERTVAPPMYYDMPRPEQYCPRDDTDTMKERLCCPNAFFGVDHPNTTWLINLLSDTSEWRLQKCLDSVHSRPLLDEEKFYQVVDRPSYYMGEGARLERSMFSPHTMLMLNPFGVALYLKSSVGANKLATALKVSRNQSFQQLVQYATAIHDRQYDLAIFCLDFLCIKRENYSGLDYLAIIGWDPSSPTSFTYRRKYYQFTVPFSDWLDVTRYLLKQNPRMNVAALVKTMHKVQFNVNSAYNFSMSNMKEISKVMIEAFQLVELREDSPDGKAKKGYYAGRKMLKQKSASAPDKFKEAFATCTDEQNIRPVIPNVISYARRLLTYEYYFDNKYLYSLPQVIRAIDTFRDNDFFMGSQIVRSSEEPTELATYRVYTDPLIFQINYFVHLKCEDNIPVRKKSWETILATEGEQGEKQRGWYHRFDTLNCVSLLVGLLQNALIKNFSEILIESLCDLIVKVLSDADLIEAVVRYSYYDTFFGLGSVINCVPNLMSKTVMRLLKKAPIALTKINDLATLLRMFTFVFFTDAKGTKTAAPKTMDDMDNFLNSRLRRNSMVIEGVQTAESASGASSAGASGSCTVFIRKYTDMPEIDPVSEEDVNNASESTKKQKNEQEHVREYKALEVDYRYSSLFPNYYDGLNKVKVELNERKTYKECEDEAKKKSNLL